MIFDTIALWTGRVLLVSLAWSIISFIFYWTITYMFRYLPAFRFAIYLWISQRSKGKEELVREIHTYDGKVWEFKEAK